MCRIVGAVCPNGAYRPAGGGEETIDSSKHRITNPARILAISIPGSPPTTLVSAIPRPNVSAHVGQVANLRRVVNPTIPARLPIARRLASQCHSVFGARAPGQTVF